jgi:hypothetical protein
MAVSNDTLKILAKGWPAFFFVGALFVLLGAGGKVSLESFNINVESLAFRYVLLAIGIPAIIFAAYILTLDVKIIFAEAEAKRGRHPQIKPESLGFSLKKPAPNTGDRQAVPIKLEGSFAKLPPQGYEVWLFFQKDVKGETHLWPQHRLRLTGRNWDIEYRPEAEHNGAERTLRFYLIGPDALKLILNHRRFVSGSTTPVGILLPTSDMNPVTPPLHYRIK